MSSSLHTHNKPTFKYHRVVAYKTIREIGGFKHWLFAKWNSPGGPCKRVCGFQAIWIRTFEEREHAAIRRIYAALEDGYAISGHYDSKSSIVEQCDRRESRFERVIAFHKTEKFKPVSDMSVEDWKALDALQEEDGNV